MSALTSIDWLVIFAYFVIVFTIAFWSSRKKTTRESTEGYFLGGRNVSWFVIGASLFASNIGSEHLVGLAGTAAANGIAVGQFEILASLILLLLGWLFVPFYLRSGVYTMPEFLERRYSPAARWYLAVVSIIGYVITKISVTIAAGGIIFQSLMGLDFWTGAIIVVAATGVYTVFGGLRAVLYTDLIQMFVFVIGAITVTVVGLYTLGGWGSMVSSTEAGFLSLWKPISDPDFPWTGIILGAPILGVWYWCTDQYIVQRVLSAKNVDNARRGAIFGGFLKVLPLFIFVIPGVIAHSLVESGHITLATPDQALPTLIAYLLPQGLKGLVVSGLLAALMSSLSSVFNSCSTLITVDIYQKLRPKTSERNLVWVGQVSTLALVVLGLLWIPMMKYISGQLYQYLQSVQAYIAPPIACVFLLGLFFPRLNARGAVTTLFAGLFLGMSRLVLELYKNDLGSGLLYWYASINFLHFALLLFVLCSVVFVIVSLSSPPPPSEKIEGLTYSTLGTSAAALRLTSAPQWRRKDLLITSVLILIVASLWIYFS